MTRTALLASCVALVHGAVPGELPVWARGGKMWADMQRGGPRIGNSTANFYTQLIDHANPSAGTYQQRWYMDTTYYQVLLVCLWILQILSTAPRPAAAVSVKTQR